MRHAKKPGWGKVYPDRWPDLSWGDRRVWWLENYRAAHDGVWPECVVCGASWELHSGRLHHRRYAKPGREAWEDLLPLCHRHHEALSRVINHNSALRRLSREQATDKAIACLRSEVRESVTK
jgi:hypothetical protein